MKNEFLAPMHTWLIEPLEPKVAESINRLRRAPDVRRMAIMPDVHLANDVCIGLVIATSRLIYPQAVGGDIGCGILAVGFDVLADRLNDPTIAGGILARLGESIPATRRHRRHQLPLPAQLIAKDLSLPPLAQIRDDEGRLQFGTLGSGNHFIELQSDEQQRLWLMIHSGSRVMGQVIREHHLAQAEPVGSGLRALDATTDAGAAYLNDVEWARRYAAANRRAMAESVAEVLADAIDVRAEWTTLVDIEHNHVARETHEDEPLWVHRKGAMPAGAGVAGLLPGSMATLSFHVEGRGEPKSLNSSAHGAGRLLSREAARRAITEREVYRQMKGIWFDYRMARLLREESPAAYKDVRWVLRAEHELVKVTRALRPVLNYKGR
jgi:tRNA-splicing ligase RtcB